MNIFDPMSKVDVVPDCGSDIDRDHPLTREEGDELLRNYIRRCHDGIAHLTDKYLERWINNDWLQYEG